MSVERARNTSVRVSVACDPAWLWCGETWDPVRRGAGKLKTGAGGPARLWTIRVAGLTGADAERRIAAPVGCLALCLALMFVWSYGRRFVALAGGDTAVTLNFLLCYKKPCDKHGLWWYCCIYLKNVQLGKFKLIEVLSTLLAYMELASASKHICTTNNCT